MHFDMILTLATLLMAMIAIVGMRIPADLTLVGSLTLLIVAGVVDTESALKGFGHEGVITVGALFIVADGINRTGAISGLGSRLLGSPKGIASAQWRTMLPAATMSSVLNNTPVVALMMPILIDWARKHRVSVSFLMLPLSYAAILGGMCTIIGTSTTIVIDSALKPEDRLGMFELAWVGIPIVITGMAMVMLLTKWLLPERRPAFTPLDDPREYTVEMQVEPGSALAGKTIEQAGLRNLPSMYLMEIDRDGQTLAAVGPQTVLAANDQLVFVGIVDSVVELQRIPGLKPATNQLFKLDSPRNQRCLVEAVVSNSYPYLRQSIRESHFRTRYNAAVIAVNRDGARLTGKIGDIQLRSGDTLLLETLPDFIAEQRNSRDFFLVSQVENSAPPRHEQRWFSRTIMVAMIAVVTLGYLKMVQAAMLAAMLMILTRCTRASDAKRSIDWSVLLIIGAGLGLGHAMEQSQTDQLFAKGLERIGGGNAYVVLLCVFVMTTVLSNLVTAKAAATLMIPIVAATAARLGISQAPLVVALITGAAGSFATPYGYQTNTMVYGPGGYRPADFLRMGIPLTILVGVITLIIAPVCWPFAK